MKNRKIFSTTILFVILFTISTRITSAQMRSEYRIHDRGMLHETVHNTGVIGRPWIVYASTSLPLMEWPGRSRTIIQGIEYDGHHNIFGAGIYLSANEKGKPGWKDQDGNYIRIFSFCGGIGTGESTELPVDKWSFPISIEEKENFPIIPDENGHGVLNPNYNPNEAEEIIVAKWATSTGITVTRTSRAWSYPDFDDMILYEYELEYTGDTDGNTLTIERNVPLVDVLFHITYGFGPTMLAYYRWYGSWYYGDYGGIYRTDQRYSFDPDYWLLWQTCVQTTASDKEELYAAKPEPNPDLFLQFSKTGENGGGLLAAACPGYCMLYWDTDHLAVVDPYNSERNQSEYANYVLRDEMGEYFEMDENGHILQPWNMKTDTPNTRSSKMEDRACTMDERWWTVYGEVGAPKGFPSDNGRFVLPKNPQTGKLRAWKGRARYEWDESYNGGQANQGFGPYVLELGDKLEFAVAEVIGYGGTPGKICCGGQRDKQFYPVRDWNRKVELEGKVLTEAYIDSFGYPDYINSNVITVNQVSHKAHEAYLGQEIPYDSKRMGPSAGMIFPEDNPRPSENVTKYQIPVPVPAPVIIVENTTEGTVKIIWNRVVEEFTHPRLLGKLDKFYIFRANRPCGPWKILDSLNIGDVNADNLYEYVDTDESYILGEEKYYAVTSVDEHSNQSGKTNITAHTKNVASVKKLGKVYAVPNPFIINSGFTGVGMEKVIGFYGLPKQCTIRIYSFEGQLVEIIEHDENVFSTPWFQVSKNDQDIASGVYFYVVTTPDGDQTAGKFVVIK